MKPDTRTAMQQLIRQVRASIPFDAPSAHVCSDNCRGCSVKLMEFLDTELEGWESRLADGEQPTFGDLQRLAQQSRRVFSVLERNGVLAPPSR